MKFKLVTILLLVSAGSAGCVAGPGGSYNAANRAIAGIAVGTVLGGAAGQAMGDPFTGAVLGAMAGGGIGAAINPEVFDRDTRGYCYTVDAQGTPIEAPIDSVECQTVQQTYTPTQ
jgi:uncharacterized protein YcfJ